jgi:cell division protease FtsH
LKIEDVLNNLNLLESIATNLLTTEVIEGEELQELLNQAQMV